MIPFNKPYLTGKELEYIRDAVATGHISGNGKYTRICQNFIESKWSFKKVLLTTSGTDALEMCALLINLKPGDEIIVPSFTFVSTALAFCREGAKLVFADSRPDHPGIDENDIVKLVTKRTKAIVVVHYAGVACDMDRIMEIANHFNLYVIEDAAQAIDSYFVDKKNNKKPLGTIGHLSAFSFHETKNIQCGEGGMLAINSEQFIKRAEVIWEKGTNRSDFFRGVVSKYNWIDTGSSFLPSEITAAFLWAQLEALSEIQRRRREIWTWYDKNIDALLRGFHFHRPYIPNFATNNSHMYYVVCENSNERERMISYLKSNGIMAVTHYLPLHMSPFYGKLHDGRALAEAEKYSDCLLRLPLYYELCEENLIKH